MGRSIVATWEPHEVTVLGLIKIGARVIEHIARIRVHLPTSCPERALFRTVALGCSDPAHELPGIAPQTRAADEADQPQRVAK